MRNKYQRMDDFFDFWRTIIEQNPDFDLNSENDKDSIYSTLVYLDTKPDDNDTTLIKDGTFDKWITKYQEHANINVTIDHNNPYYCYFNCNNNKIYHANDNINVFIPLNHLHIENGVNQIIEYLNSINSSFVAKVSHTIRADDFVISLNDPKEVEKLCEFIEQTPEIQTGLIKPNPFTFHYKTVTLTTGNTLSFNKTLADYIKHYIQKCKVENTVEQISTDNFILYLKNYYHEVFDNNNINTFLDKFNISNGNNRILQLINYKNITELIINSNDKQFTFEQFIDHYNKYRNSSFINEEITKYNTQYLTEEEIIKTNNMLNDAIKIMTDKVGKEQTIKCLNEYIYNNREQLITRNNNLRFNLINSNFRINMLCILTKNSISLNDYINSLNNNVKDNEDLNSVLQNAINILNKKYGYDNGIFTLDEYLRTGNNNLLTRTDNLRGYLISNNFRQRMLEYLKINNMTLTNYIKTIQEEKTKDEYLQQAIITTYNKYENDYQKGFVKYSGSQYVESALKQLLCNNSYKGFTRDNGIRLSLAENVSKEDAINIIKDAINITNKIDDSNISLETANYMTEAYIEIILERQKTLVK